MNKSCVTLCIIVASVVLAGVTPSHVAGQCFLNCPAGDGNSPGMVPMNKSPDINGSGMVDLVDLAMFAAGYPSPPRPYSYCIDYNCDGLVNLIDFSMFAQHYPHAGPVPGYCL
ncbi:MAG: hypothetical protein KAJ37_05285 [Candidatus Krumholzibacteria bacterium]|nr:hypothetical protein [Candidatus Krumholzibacteria bacterium]